MFAAGLLAILAATPAALAADPLYGYSCAAPPPTGPPTTNTNGIELHPSYNENYCLDLRGDDRSNGASVQLYACNGSPAQKWQLSRGNGKVKVAGTNFCLDAGENPTDGAAVKIWECHESTPQQQWYWTDDNRLAVTGYGLCLDVPGGRLANANALQVWSCGPGNPNQVFGAKGASEQKRSLGKRDAAGGHAFWGR